jgi:hypothetical protein
MKKFDLTEGVTYRVIKKFTDFEGAVIPKGQRLTFVAQSFEFSTGYFLLNFKERKLALLEDAGLELMRNLSDHLVVEPESRAQPEADFVGHDGVPCPNCESAMTVRTVKLVNRTQPLEIDACPDCNLLWFDRSECVTMTARSVLDLFRLLGSTGMKPRKPLHRHQCPHCDESLVETKNFNRGAHFSYWRCPTGHGDLYTFTQFLLHKNFIRELSAEALAQLRSSVRQIACSQCGAPVNLVQETACSHCGSAIAMIDPDGIAKAVRELSAADLKVTTMMEEREAVIALTDAQLAALREATEADDGNAPRDVMGAALHSIALLLDR